MNAFVGSCSLDLVKCRYLKEIIDNGPLCSRHLRLNEDKFLVIAWESIIDQIINYALYLDIIFNIQDALDS